MTTEELENERTSDASTLEQRTRRALTEDMEVALCKAGGIYAVRGESGTLYLVDLSRGTCTCPDQQKASVERCKHLRRVDIELRNRTVPTPDGRLPGPARPVADGGIESSETGRGDSTVPDRIEGPLHESDKFGRYTGVRYYRCTACGTESLRRQDLEDCCPVEEIDP